MYTVKFNPAVDTTAKLVKRIMIIVRWEKEFHSPNSLLASLTRADVRELARAYIYARSHDPAAYAMLRQWFFDELNLIIEETKPKDPSPEVLGLEEKLTQIYERLQ